MRYTRAHAISTNDAALVYMAVCGVGELCQLARAAAGELRDAGGAGRRWRGNRSGRAQRGISAAPRFRRPAAPADVAGTPSAGRHGRGALAFGGRRLGGSRTVLWQPCRPPGAGQVLWLCGCHGTDGAARILGRSHSRDHRGIRRGAGRHLSRAIQQRSARLSGGSRRARGRQPLRRERRRSAAAAGDRAARRRASRRCALRSARPVLGLGAGDSARSRQRVPLRAGGDLQDHARLRDVRRMDFRARSGLRRRQRRASARWLGDARRGALGRRAALAPPGGAGRQRRGPHGAGRHLRAESVFKQRQQCQRMVGSRRAALPVGHQRRFGYRHGTARLLLPSRPVRRIEGGGGRRPAGAGGRAEQHRRSAATGLDVRLGRASRRGQGTLRGLLPPCRAARRRRQGAICALSHRARLRPRPERAGAGLAARSGRQRQRPGHAAARQPCTPAARTWTSASAGRAAG